MSLLASRFDQTGKLTRLATRVVAPMVLVLAVLLAPNLKADIVLFTDNYGVGSETIPGYYFDFSGCLPGQPGAPTSPNGSCQPFEGYADTVTADTILATVFIGDPAGIVSDEIATTLSPPGPFTGSCVIGGIVTDPCPGFTEVSFVFSYGLDLMGSPFTCASVGGCDLTYNGSIQDVGVITWSDAGFIDYGTTTLQFQYITPEPSTLFTLTLGLGLACVFGMRRKMTARWNSSRR
jgi:hypothetical protein